MTVVCLAIMLSGCMGAGWVPDDDLQDEEGLRVGPWTGEVRRPVDEALGRMGQWLDPFEANQIAGTLVVLPS